MRNPKKVPILEPWLVRNRWEPLGFGLENRRVLGYLMPYVKTNVINVIVGNGLKLDNQQMNKSSFTLKNRELASQKMEKHLFTLLLYYAEL